MKKKKVKSQIPTYKLASFRKKRGQLVQSEIDKLLTSLRKNDLSSSIKKNLKQRLHFITYFDHKSYRGFLVKYVKFVSLTLDINIIECLDHLLTKFEESVCTKGITTTLQIFKGLYGDGCRLSTSNLLSESSYIKTTRSGVPKMLGPLIPLLKGTINERRAALATLQIIKLVEYRGKDFSIKTIVQEPKVPMNFNNPPRVGNFFERVIEKFGDTHDGIDLHRLRRMYIQTLELTFPNKFTKNRLEDVRKESDLYISARNGPNGPSLTTVVCDHCSMEWGNDAGARLLEHINSIVQITNNKDLKILMDNFSEEDYIVESTEKLKTINSKISLKEEPWGRLRPFAICDYFSQSSLKGLHNYLFRWLENQKEDGTFRQDYCSEQVRLWTVGPQDKSCESADLSAATDSIPVEVQGEILEQIVGQEFAKTWVSVVSDREFKSPDGSMIRYRTGQPMGILSSWAMLAVWHHIMVRTCLMYLDISNNTDEALYYVIGDDVAMHGADIFRVYEVLVGYMQNVGISKVKGYHQSTQTLSNPFKGEDCNTMITAEFAKRIFCNGHELTVVPPDEVYTSLEKPTQFPELLKSLVTRGYPEFERGVRLPALAQLSRDTKLALLLGTNPLVECPYLNGNIQSLMDQSPYNQLPWFQPQFNIDEFKQIYIKELKGTIIASLLSAVTALSRWREAAATGGEVKVKSWRYTCETQGLLLYLTAEKCKLSLDRILSDEGIKEAFPQGGPINWRTLKKYIRTFQTIFELDLALGINPEDKKKKKKMDTDSIRFMNTFVSKVVRKVIKSWVQSNG